MSALFAASPGRGAVVAVALIGAFSSGCNAARAAETDGRLSAVEHQVAVAQTRLEAVKAEVAAAEERAEAARVEAEFQACQAKVTQLRAEVERRRAQCAKDLADRNLCIAHNSERTATTGIVGCGLGLAVAALSAGSAAPWALGGCAAGTGAGALSGDECPEATCAANLDAIDQDVVRESGLEKIPRCGGFAGLEVAEGRAVALHGVPIKEVLPGTYADSANVAVGDILTAVQGSPAADAKDVARLLTSVSERQSLRVDVVRGGRLFHLTAPASRRVGPQRLADTVKLGAILGDPVEQVPYLTGVTVTMVEPGSPAASTGVQPGDQLLSVNVAGEAAKASGAFSLDDLEASMGSQRPGTQVDLRLRRAGRNAIAHLQLEPRAGRVQL